MIRILPVILLAVFACETANTAEPLPIDPLWKSEDFRRVITGSFGIDTRIEPLITTDEEGYLNDSAQMMSAGDRKAAIEILAESSILEDSPAMIFSLATLQFEEGDDELARVNLEKAIEKFPNFRDAHRNLAVSLIRLEKFKEAEEHLVRAIELGARDGLTFGLMGYCYSLNEDYQPALDAYRIAALTQPDQRQWKIGQAEALQALNRPTEAVSIYRNIISEDPSQLTLWLVEADALMSLNKNLDAISNLELAHRAKILPAEGTLSLGHLYLQNDLPDEALERYLAAIARDTPPELHRVVEALEFLTNIGQWTRAAIFSDAITSSEPMQAIISSDENNSETLSRLLRHRALIELENGDPENGAKLVADWLSQEPLDGHAIILLARFKQEAGLREEAEMLLEQAANLPEHAAAAHLAHGKLLVSMAEYNAAVEHLEQSYQLQPTKSLAGYIEAVRELAD